MIRMTTPTGHRCLFRSLLLLILTSTIAYAPIVTATTAEHSHNAYPAYQPLISVSAAGDAAPVINAPAAMIRVGVLAYLGTEQADQEWAPVQQFLQARSEEHTFELQSLRP